MKNKLHGLLLLSFVLIQFKGLSQGGGAFSNVLTENSVFTGSTIDHKACQEIRLLPGYRYQATGNNRMNAAVDPYLTCAIDYTNTSLNSDNLPPLNTGLIVGTTAGQFDVSHSGAATYQIPIFLPPGTNGLQPNINLYYNSQSGDGLLGYGWSISGLSAICRSGKSLYYDNSAKGITLTNDDNFTLDGQMLFPFSGSNGNNNTKYATEIESYSEITSLGTAGYGPSYFVLETKDGILMEFGNTQNSKIESHDNATIITWLLNKVTDPFGNYYTIRYIELNDGEGIQFYPDIIEYTGNLNASLTPYNKIKFVYGEKNDVSRVFVGGTAILNKRLLTAIEVYAEQVKAREYVFEYSFEKGSILTEVSEIGINNETLNPIRLSYDELASAVTHEFETVTINNELPTNLQGSFHGGITHLTIDFNGDGIEDVVRLVGSDITDIYEWELINKKTNEITSGASPLFNGLVKHTQNNYVVDFNGDGYQDFMLFEGQINNNIGQDISNPTFHLMVSNKINGFTLAQTINFPNLSSPDSRNKFIIGDFDGDAATDLFVYFYNLDKGYIYSFKNSTLNLVLNNIDLGDEKLQFYSTDMNGDGKNEVFLTFPNQWNNSFYSITLEYNGTALVNHSGVSGYPNSYYNEVIEEPVVFTGDFNGDRNTDLLLYKFSTGWEIAYSKGVSNGFTTMQCALIGNPQSDENLLNYDIIDLNGDGKSDVFVSAIFNNQIMYSYVYFSNGMTFQDPIPLISSQSISLINGMQFGNYDGSGNLTCYYRNLNGTLTKLTFANVNNQKKCTNFRNGLGHDTRIIYGNLAQLGTEGSYTKYSNATYPIWDLTLPMNVVKSVEVENGIGTFNTFNYKYEGSKLHVIGKGFLGFQKFSVFNLASNTKQDFNYIFNSNGNNFFQPILQQIEVISISNNQPISSIAYQYYFRTNLKQNNPTEKRYTFHPNIITSYDFINGITTTNTIVKDLSGNVLSQTTNNGVETSIQTFFYDKSCSLLPFDNRLMSSNLSTTRTGETPYNRSASFQYDGLECSLSKQISDIGTETVYNRNNFGNIVYEAISAPSIQPTFVNYVFDAKGRFPINTTNALGHLSQAEFNPIFGIVTKGIDSNGLISEFTYDGFGGLKTSKSPIGIVSETTQAWAVNPTMNSIFSVTETTPGTPVLRTYFSLTGETVKNETEGFDGAVISNSQTYNELGLTVSSVELNSGLTTIYTYEPLLQRIKTITAPSGATTTHDYSANQTQTTSQQGTITQSVTEKFDASGKIIEVIDDGGTITYSYFSSGKPKCITTPDNSTVTMQYDDFGRQIQLNDPSTGSMFYAYDAFDRLVHQTDANQKSVYLTYDVLGRTVLKEYSSGAAITYEYDPANALGLLKKTQLTSGTNDGFIVHSSNYTYNDLVQVSELSEVFDNKTLTHQYEYDNLGRVTKQTFPGGYILDNEYNDLGYLKSIKNASQPLWECISLTNRLQPQQSKLNGGIDLLTNYNNLGILIQKQASSLQSNQINLIYKQNYNFDSQTGNLMQRSRNLPFAQESFTYDNLYRLKEVLYPNQQIKQELNYSFNNNGNISRKSDAGTFLYENDNPFAITKVQYPEPALATAQQDISYTAYNQPLQLNENALQLNYQYGPDEERRTSMLQDAQGNVLKKITYSGNYEIVEINGNTYEVNYINSPDGLIAIAVKKNNNPIELYYTETDHLGSILGLYKETGQPVYAQSFDAWGRERNPSTWEYTVNNTPKPEWLIRGYTGHEMLPEFGLVNMNGRMYDPVLGRMLSPDNFVQDPSSTQSYNRYSYCWNNPLKYTDPSGELVNFIVGGIIGGMMGFINADMGGKTGWEMVAQIAIGAAVGTVTFGAGAKAMSAGSTVKTSAAAGTQTVTNGMKLSSGLYSGASNAANMIISKGEFEAKDLLYFISGFVGGYIGADVGMGAGIATGGFSNVITGLALGNINSEDIFYESAQHFVGGALSGMAGANAASSMAGNSKSSILGKFGGKFLNYGLQANAYDFAYTKKDKFLKKNFGQHFGTFANGGLGGVMQGLSMSNSLVNPLRSRLPKAGLRFASSLGSYYMENQMSYVLKANFYGLESKGFPAKMGVSAGKSLFNALMLWSK
jgi:RHS repeat-associated protein